jgi:hypothetical protein
MPEIKMTIKGKNAKRHSHIKQRIGLKMKRKLKDDIIKKSNIHIFSLPINAMSF